MTTNFNLVDFRNLWQISKLKNSYEKLHDIPFHDWLSPYQGLRDDLLLEEVKEWQDTGTWWRWTDDVQSGLETAQNCTSESPEQSLATPVDSKVYFQVSWPRQSSKIEVALHH